jgi:hypothetical protein
VRALATIAVLLLIGVIVSLAVAWSCAAWAPLSLEEYSKPDDRDKAWWTSNVPDGFAPEPAPFSHGASGFGVRRQFLWGSFTRSDDASVFMRQVRYRAGWPVKTVEGVQWRRLGSTPPQWDEGLYAVGVTKPVTLPVKPLWGGLAINSALVAAVVGLVWFGPVVVRGRIRRWRNRCPACGYPFGVAPVCTECGKTRRGVTDNGSADPAIR